MSSAHDHQILIDYLLGALPETEAERFDELSIADDEFVSRLTAVENDLVDAYVRGDLSEDARRQFRAHYLSSQKRRDKVAFADALRLHEQRDEALPEKTAAPESRRRFAPWRFLTVAGPAPAWALAAAAVTLAAAYLFITNGRLRQELARSQSARASLEGRTRDLWSQLEHEQSARSAIPEDSRRPGDLGERRSPIRYFERRQSGHRRPARRLAVLPTLFRRSHRHRLRASGRTPGQLRVCDRVKVAAVFQIRSA